MKTEIAFVLDRSGSMESIRTATIQGFNATSQQLHDADAPLSAILREEVQKRR